MTLANLKDFKIYVTFASIHPSLLMTYRLYVYNNLAWTEPQRAMYSASVAPQLPHDLSPYAVTVLLAQISLCESSAYTRTCSQTLCLFMTSTSTWFYSLNVTSYTTFWISMKKNNWLTIWVYMISFSMTSESTWLSLSMTSESPWLSLSMTSASTMTCPLP